MASEKVKRFRENLAKDPDYYSRKKVLARMKAWLAELKERDPERYRMVREMLHQNPPGAEDEALLLELIADAKDPESEKMFGEFYRDLSGRISELLMLAD